MRERPIRLLRRAVRRRKARVLTTAFGITMFVVLPGCGGGARKADTDDWISDVCDAAQDLSDERADALLDFFEVDPNDGEAMYEGFGRYLKRYGNALGDFEDAVGEAGQPDVKDGDRIVKAVRQFARDERKSNESARKDLVLLDKGDDGLAADVDDIFFDIEFADLRELLEDSDAADSDTIIDLIEEDSSCAFALFSE